jgi:hypothetical protein
VQTFVSPVQISLSGDLAPLKILNRVIPGQLLKKASDQGLLREMIGFVAQSMMGLEMAGLIHAWRIDLGLSSRRCFWLSVPANHRGTARSSMFDTAQLSEVSGSGRNGCQRHVAAVVVRRDTRVGGSANRRRRALSEMYRLPIQNGRLYEIN